MEAWAHNPDADIFQFLQPEQLQNEQLLVDLLQGESEELLLYLTYLARIRGRIFLLQRRPLTQQRKVEIEEFLNFQEDVQLQIQRIQTRQARFEQLIRQCQRPRRLRRGAGR